MEKNRIRLALVASLMLGCLSLTRASIDPHEVAVLDAQVFPPGFSLNNLYLTRSPAFDVMQMFRPQLDFITVKNLTTHEERWANRDRTTFNRMANGGELRGTDVLIVNVDRVRLGSPQEALRYTEFFNGLGDAQLGQWVPGTLSGASLGERCWHWVWNPARQSADVIKQDGFRLVAVKGSSRIKFHACSCWDGRTGATVDPAVAESIARAYVTRYQPAQDIHDGEDSFQLKVEVKSKLANPGKGQQVRVVATSGHYPLHYEVRITRGRDEVYLLQFLDSWRTGPLDFSWDGKTNGGQQVPGGRYRLTVLAYDESNGTASQSVKVNVVGPKGNDGQDEPEGND